MYGAQRLLPWRLRDLAADLGAVGARRARPVSGAAGRASEFVVRFQQTTGPVQAKGVEDTACYRWSRLVALNEVGGDPDRFGVRPREFHAVAGRLAADWPATMTTLSTHDTKRQEDIRARLAVLAELPREWGEQVRQWHERAVTLRSTAVPRPPWTRTPSTCSGRPWSGPGRSAAMRLAGYLTKAIREAKRRTSWTSPDPEYEAAVLGLAARVLDDPELSGSVGELRRGHRGRRAWSTRSARSSSSSPCRECPTSTRGASWPGCPWSTRTTGGRWASRTPHVLTSPTLDAEPTRPRRGAPSVRRRRLTPGASCSSPPGRCGCGAPGPSGSPGATSR